MPEETAVLLTPPHNYAVVQLPGRSSPGVVFQGDSLAILAERAAQLARRAKGSLAESDAQWLSDDLQEVVRSYLSVLEARSIEPPFTYRPDGPPSA
jgi:hypothetical protein